MDAHVVAAPKRAESRRSLSLLANLDLAAIIRSSSLTSRRVSMYDESDPHTCRRSRHYDKPEQIERALSSNSKDKTDDENDTVPELPASPTKQPPLSAANVNPSPRKRVPSRIPTKTDLPPKNFHLFGIPLPSPRKSSFSSSRPTTPSDAPSVASKPKSSKPKPPIAQGTPASSLSKFFVAGTGLRVSSAPETQRKPSPSKIPTPVKQQHSPAPSTPAKPIQRTAKPTGAHISSSTIVVEPGSVSKSTPNQQRRYMSEVGNTTAPAPRALPAAPRSSISTPRASLAVANTSPPVQTRVRSLSTGASGSRSVIGVSTRVSATATILSPRERRTSTDSSSHSHRPYRATVRLDGIAESKGKEGEPDVSASGNSRRVTATSPTTDDVPQSSQAPMPTATTTTKHSLGSVASRKHGSFDFERPGWGSLASRSPATTLGIGPRTRREVTKGSSVDESGRVRTTNAGLAGVGAARFYASTSAAAVNRNVRVVPPPTPPELEPSHTGASASTSASRPNVGTSSWGRTTGKRLSAGFSKLTSGLGLGGKSTTSKASTMNVGKDRQHPKFPFEPPVSMNRELSLDSQRDRERVTRPLSPGKGHNPSHSTSSTSSTHTGVSVGYRSGTKGRSLDLGLGLSWAPTKVREDAVMPESSFGRSLSASRRERRGREVAEEFRHALDENGFRAFKKYVHRFDGNEIPFDGPTGIVARVERLLRKANHLDEDERTRLLDSFVKLTLSAA